MSLHFSGKGGERLEICPQHYHVVTFQDCGSHCQAYDVSVWLLYLGDCSYENKANSPGFPLPPCHGWLGAGFTGQAPWPEPCQRRPGPKACDPPNISDPAHPTSFVLQKHPVLPSGIRLAPEIKFGSCLCVPPSLLQELSTACRELSFTDRTVYYSWFCPILHCIPGSLRRKGIYFYLFIFGHNRAYYVSSISFSPFLNEALMGKILRILPEIAVFHSRISNELYFIGCPLC